MSGHTTPTWPALSPEQRCVTLIQGLEREIALPGTHPGLVEAHQPFKLLVGDAGRALGKREGGSVNTGKHRAQTALFPWGQPLRVPAATGSQGALLFLVLPEDMTPDF